MAAAERASIFDAAEATGEPDLSEFAPRPRGARPKPDSATTRAVAERMGFTSREPAKPAAPAQADASPVRGQRRHTTGRNRQLNLKVTDEALTRFYALAEGQGWVLGQAFEEAVAALEAKLAG